MVSVSARAARLNRIHFLFSIRQPPVVVRLTQAPRIRFALAEGLGARRSCTEVSRVVRPAQSFSPHRSVAIYCGAVQGPFGPEG